MFLTRILKNSKNVIMENSPPKRVLIVKMIPIIVVKKRKMIVITVSERSVKTMTMNLIK